MVATATIWHGGLIMDKKETMRESLMNSAIHIVYREGIENTTTALIAKEVKLNEAYIYRCFKNKDDLLAKTFDFIDSRFLQYVLEHFSIMELDGEEYQERCRALFDTCWEYIMQYPEHVIFYIRYYYSQYFQRLSYDSHMERYSVLIDKMRPACHPSAVVTTVLHHIFDTLLGQARKQILHPENPVQTQEDTFWLLFSVLKCGKGI